MVAATFCMVQIFQTEYPYWLLSRNSCIYGAFGALLCNIVSNNLWNQLQLTIFNKEVKTEVYLQMYQSFKGGCNKWTRMYHFQRPGYYKVQSACLSKLIKQFRKAEVILYINTTLYFARFGELAAQKVWGRGYM